MIEELAERSGGAADAAAIAKAHAIYTPVMLAFYDRLVHGFSNRFAWHCPTERLLDLYRNNLASRHLEAGVGTGLFIGRAAPTPFERLVLLDINRHCLALSARRLARFRPMLQEANLLAPLDLDLEPVDSIGLTYVLHCLPGRMPEKLTVVDHLRPFMRGDTVLFGATILGRGIEPNAAARALLALYNSKGVFNNRMDDLEALETGLRQRFGKLEIERQGCVALFRAEALHGPGAVRNATP
jgi:SAM-dependent methyltransferase